MPEPIDQQRLVALITADAVTVVEALGADYFADGHLPGAVNLPHTADDSVVRALAVEAERPIVVYGSRGGAEASALARRIERWTDVDVYVYDAGKEDWAEGGLAIERPPAD